MQAQHLDRELLDGLSRLGRENEATLFMALQAAFAVLLGRYSRSRDVVVGSPIAGRTHRGTEPLIGFFVNTLTLRTELGGNPSFLELLGQVREKALESWAHQDIPFEMLVEELRPARSLSHTPMFQIRFGLGNNERTELSLPGLEAQALETGAVTAKFDLELLATETEDGLQTHWIYAKRLFERKTIERLAESYKLLLSAIVRDPQ